MESRDGIFTKENDTSRILWIIFKSKTNQIDDSTLDYSWFYMKMASFLILRPFLFFELNFSAYQSW